MGNVEGQCGEVTIKMTIKCTHCEAITIGLQRRREEWERGVAGNWQKDCKHVKHQRKYLNKYLQSIAQT